MFIAARRAVPSTSSIPLIPPEGKRMTLLRGKRGTVTMEDVLERGEQEAAGAASRVADRVGRARLETVHHRRDQRARGEILARAGLDVLGALGEQFLVGVTLDVGVPAGPLFFIDEIDN
jgi:hypothetical protein